MTRPPAPPLPAGGARQWSGPSQGEGGPKTFWETVWPTIVPYPAHRQLLIAPSGPGSYTLYDLLAGSGIARTGRRTRTSSGARTPNPFFNVDFRYLDNPNNTETFLFDSAQADSPGG